MRYRSLAGYLGLSFLILAGSSAYAQAPKSGAAPAAGSATQADTSRGDKNFLHDSTMAGIAAVEASKLAVAKATDPKIKAYAQRVLKDHGAVVAELAALSARKGIEPVSEPSMLQRTQLKALESLDGADFDKMYTKQFGVVSQQNELLNFQNASAHVEDPEIRAYAKSRVSGFQDRVNAGRTLGRTDRGM